MFNEKQFFFFSYFFQYETWAGERQRAFEIFVNFFFMFVWLLLLFYLKK